MKKRKVMNPTNLIGLIFFLIGLCQLAATVCILVIGNGGLQNMEKVTGMVTGTGDSRTYVSYRYMGRDYEDELSFYSSSLGNGDRIELYVDPMNPENAKSPIGTYIPAFVFGIMGAIFTVLGGSFLFVGYRGKVKKFRLQEQGRKIYARVTGGRVCYNYSVNGRHPFKLECKYEEEFSNSTYLFSSDYMWEDPEMFVGQQVTVYVDDKDMSKYYVDTESLKDPVPEGSTVYDYR